MTRCFSILTAAAIFSACSSDDALTPSSPKEEEGQGKIQITFTAGQEGDGISSKSVQTSDLHINWESTDQLSVFDGTGNNQFSLVSGAGTTTATFSGSVATGASGYYALHPYQSTATFSGTTISNITLPSVQTARAGSFAPEAALMVAVADANKNLAFHNICACVKFTVSSDVAARNIKTITFTANGGQTLAGTFDVTNATSATPSVSNESNTSSEISLVPATGSTYIAAGDYYFSMLPVTISGDAGFTITFLCTNNDGTTYESAKTYSTATHSLELKRNVNTSIGTVSPTVQDEWVDMGTTKDGSTSTSVLWRNRNIGATSITDFGDYYAWGETEVKYSGFGSDIKTQESSSITNYYNDITLKTCPTWAEGSRYNSSISSTWSQGYVYANTPFCTSVSEQQGLITAAWNKYNSTDLSVLQTSDDVAYQTLNASNSGQNVRIPTVAEMQQLLTTKNSDITWTWKDSYLGTGVPGYLLKSASKGTHIFLPAGGRCEGLMRYLHTNQQSNYWTSTVNTDNYSYANVLFFNEDAAVQDRYAVSAELKRCMGCLIRPIKDKTN